MKILDRYIIRQFLGTFFFAIFLFTTIAVVIDLTEKIEDIISKHVPTSALIFDYYFSFIPFIDALLAPLFVFISVIFFTSRLANQSQIVAVLSSGTSFWRLMRPYLVASTTLAIGLFFFNHFFVPNANKRKIAFEYRYFNGDSKFADLNIHLQVQKNKFIYMQNYNSDSTGYKFSYEVLNEGKLVFKLRADQIKWMTKTQSWQLSNYTVRTFDREGEHLSHGLIKDTVLGFKPNDFSKRLSLKEEMNSIELGRYIDKLKAQGGDQVAFFEVEYHRRTAGAAAVIILTLIGYAMSSRKIRGGLGVHIVGGLLLSGAYIIFMQFSTTFSTNANLPAFLGVWIPNFLFGILAAILLWKAPK